MENLIEPKVKIYIHIMKNEYRLMDNIINIKSNEIECQLTDNLIDLKVVKNEIKLSIGRETTSLILRLKDEMRYKDINMVLSLKDG